MTLRIGINGFGRMGRALFRIIEERGRDLELVAVNELGPAPTTVNLLARDSVHGRFERPITLGEGGFQVGDRWVQLLGERDPSALPWADLGVDVVVEATGHFRTRETAAAHLRAGARRVVVSAPCKGADATIVIGVNDAEFDPARHEVVSNASCTTNCLVPMIKVLQDRFGIEQGFMTTVHAYTGDQALVDGPHKDPRRARAAGLNIVPTTTGAARATSGVIAEMAGRLDGTALRVPVADGSITDLVALVERKATVPEVNEAFAEAAGGSLSGVLEYSSEPLVSTDIIGSPASCVFDSPLTMASGRLVKVLGWYDNEWGYANRLAELTELVGTRT
jgi:glyceraldehyde 3-phosphate dehydrogenase